MYSYIGVDVYVQENKNDKSRKGKQYRLNIHVFYFLIFVILKGTFTCNVGNTSTIIFTDFSIIHSFNNPLYTNGVFLLV